MNRLLKVGSFLITLLPAVYLLGCGGSSGDSVAGIDGSGAPVTSTSGTVNGFGSVIVNGIRYHSDSAKIMVNGELADENSLRTGYQVRVTGTLNNDGTGNANTIEFNANLIGSIASIDLQKEQLVLLEQTVQITNTTIFDPAIDPNNLSGLTVGSNILISGQRNSEGLIAATRVELAPQIAHQLSGVISNINLADSTFTLNNLTVNYSAATIRNNANNPLTNGLHVSIAGALENMALFQATIISVQNISFSSEVKTANIEGFITRFVSTTDFDIAGVTCSSNSATIYSNGTSANLALGSSLKLNGTVNAAGVLVAQIIEFRQKVINEIAGEVVSVSTPINSAIASGNFIIAGTSIQTNNATAYEDRSGDRLRRFNLSDIRQGNFLKVSGYTSQTTFIATKIERRTFGNNSELRYEGIATLIEPHGFTVYGQSIQISSTTEIRSANGSLLTEEQFLAQALNQQVRVMGTISDGVFTATRIEIRQQNQDDFHRDGSGAPEDFDGHDGGPHRK